MSTPISNPMSCARLLPRFSVCAVLACLGLLPAAEAASNRTIPVTTNADSGAGSLRAAIAQAAADTNDTITFAPNLAGPITLTSGELLITGSVTITGPGAGSLTVSGGGASRVFHVRAGVVRLSGLTVSQGAAPANAPGGGGITVDGGAFLSVSACVFNANTAATGLGGALYLSPNAAAFVDTTTVSSNSAVAGGGLFVDAGPAGQGSLALTNSTVSNNTASGTGASGGAGLFVAVNALAGLTNDTISGNTASAGDGGGVDCAGALTNVVSVTVAFNQAAGGSGGGLAIEPGGSAILQGTLAADNAAGASPDAAGAFTSSGSNLIGDGTGAAGFTDPHDQVGTAAAPIDPRLGPLQNNGGPTQTESIDAASPALNVDFSVNTPATDQRGVTRPIGPRADIGAYEAPSPPGAPTGLTATAGFGRITLVYTGTPDASGYNVFRGLTPGGEDFLNPINGTTPVRQSQYTDLGLTNGTTYYYVVEGVNAVGAGSPSNEAFATPADTRLRGSALAWGDNTTGELGDGDFIRSPNPRVVAAPPGQNRPLTNIVQVAAGAGFSLALTADGYVLAWGDDTYGQLGDGNSSYYEQFFGVRNAALRRNIPGPVLTAGYNPRTGLSQTQPLSGMVAIAAGREFALALGADGTVYAWGRNQLGQLGNGSTNPGFPSVYGFQDYAYANPVVSSTRATFTGAVALAAGGFHSLALMNDGTVMSWGSDTAGQLGNGATGPGADSLYPTPVSALTGVLSVAAGEYHSLALGSGGTVYAWGYDQDGELGDGGFSANQAMPQQVFLNSLSPATQIAAGQYHSLALLADGSVSAWGLNSNGQLGSGTVGSFGNLPAQALPGGIVSLSAGAAFSQAITTTHILDDFGANAAGQLGDGLTTDSSTSVNALTPAGAIQPYLYAAAGGAQHGLAIQNLPPTATRLSYTVGQFGRVVTAPGLLTGAGDPEGDGPLTALPTVSRATAHGTVTVRTDGSFTYAPTAGYQGGDSFTYQVSDGLGVSAPATVTLNVTTLTLRSLAVTPTAASSAESATTQFRAIGTFNDSSQADFTAQAVWTSSDPTVATVSQGLATASAANPGTTTITAAYGGFSATATLTVTRTLRTVTVTPANPRLARGLSLPFAATAAYTDGATADVTAQVAWTTSDSTVATVSNATGSQGVARAVGVGTATVTAAFPGTSLTGGTTLTVSPATLASIAVTPANATLTRGGTQSYTATGLYTDGSQTDLTQTVVWTTANSHVATVDVSGAVTAQGVGQTQVTATEPAEGGSPSVSGQTGVSVVDPTTVPRSHILYNLSGGQVSLWDVDTAFNVNEHLFGPYTDAPASPTSVWAATGVASAPDGTSRILWNNPDARVMLWAVDAGGNLTTFAGFGPYNDDGKGLWHAVGVSVGPDDITHILWANADHRMMFWNVDAQGNLLSLIGYGPYTDNSQPNAAGNLWSATALATGPDGTSRVLWNNTDGRVMVWSVDAQGGMLSVTGYGPYTDDSQPNPAGNRWRATAVSVGTDGNTHLLWNNTDGRVMFWNLDGQNNLLGLAGYGPYSGWSAPACSTGPQNDSHILWGRSDGTVAYWDVNTSDFSVNYKIYTPGTSYMPVALSTGP